MAVQPPRYFLLVIFSLSLLACKLFTRTIVENVPHQKTLPPPAVSTRAYTPTPTHPPQPTSTLKPTYTPTPAPTLSSIQSPTLMAFITAPQGVQPQPYVLLSAYGASPDDSIIQISGKIGPVEFACPGTHCLLPVLYDSLVTFKAHTRLGNASEEVQATVRTTWSADGYTVSIESVSPAVIFTDYCGEVWELGAGPNPDWALFPQSPPELNTNKVLHFLAGQLISNGVVDAEECPGNGFSQTGPNPCGLEHAAEAMLEWQNQYDFYLWLAGRDMGVPPILLKTLIEHESQYWPMSQRFYLDEYGLAQINELGADVALRWDVNLYQDICSQTLMECPSSYYRLSPSYRAMLRGSLIKMVYADCPTCPHSVDTNKALESIPINALILRYNCNDTKFLLDQYSYNTSYEDYWKFTMVAYHSGINCLDFAINQVIRQGWEVTWSQVSNELRCSGAREYVDELWSELETFQDFQFTSEQTGAGFVPSHLSPTQTPVPTPTPALSHAKIRVQVFADANENDTPEAGEAVNGVQVRLEFADGMVLTQITENGAAIFDLTGFPIGMGVAISLPSFYRNEWLTIPAEGETLVTFKFTVPPFPTALP